MVIHINRGTVEKNITNKTRKRGKAQRDGRPPLFYKRRTFVAACENFVTMATRVGWGPVWMIPLHCPTTKTPTLVWIWHLSPIIIQAELWPILCPNSRLYNIRCRTFVATCENFVTMAKWVGRTRGPVWMTPWNWPISKTPVWYKNMGLYPIQAEL